jgi:DNA-binding IscR family transcriptional regulator
VLAELARAGVVESVRGVGGGYRFAGNARRLTLMDVIRLFEDFDPAASERGEKGEPTPVGRALAAVLSEIDEHAKATMSSITLATMLRLIDRQQAGTNAVAPRPAPHLSERPARRDSGVRKPPPPRRVR